MKKPAVTAAGLDLNFNNSNVGPTAGEHQSPLSLSVLRKDWRNRNQHVGVRRRTSRIPASQAEHRHGRITQSSSRRTPCPVCGRTRNGHCRWGNGIWHCFCGDTNAPPSNIRIGGVIEIGGELAALVTTAGGHSGNSYVFRTHRAIGRTRVRQVSNPAPQDNGYIAWIEVVISDADAALAITDFQLHNAPWLELQHLLALINVSTELLDQCLLAVKTNTRQGWGHQISVLEKASSALRKQKAMADHFRWHYLGEVE